MEKVVLQKSAFIQNYEFFLNEWLRLGPTASAEKFIIKNVDAEVAQFILSREKNGNVKIVLLASVIITNEEMVWPDEPPTKIVKLFKLAINVLIRAS